MNASLCPPSLPYLMPPPDESLWSQVQLVKTPLQQRYRCSFISCRVCCSLHLSTGELVFTSDAQMAGGETPPEARRVTFMATDKTKLFPTVVVTPTTENVVEFDFTPGENCRTLSSCFIGPTPTTPTTSSGGQPKEASPFINPCPPRMKLMLYSKSLWSRQSTDVQNYSTETSGALEVHTKEMRYDVCVTLPQEDKVMDILEISEDLELMDFHVWTLEAFCAVCSHSNISLAKNLVQFVNSDQLLKCLHVSWCGGCFMWVVGPVMWVAGPIWVLDPYMGIGSLYGSYNYYRFCIWVYNGSCCGCEAGAAARIHVGVFYVDNSECLRMGVLSG